MQILNISVMNRPQKSLTSLMYVLYIPDGINTEFNVLDANMRDVVNTYKTTAGLAPTFGCTGATLRSVVLTVDIGYSEFSHTFGCTGAVLSDTMVRYTIREPQVFSHTFGCTGAVLKDALIRYTVAPQVFSHTFSVKDAILEDK